jgi:hypothetical protein
VGREELFEVGLHTKDTISASLEANLVWVKVSARSQLSVKYPREEEVATALLGSSKK